MRYVVFAISMCAVSLAAAPAGASTCYIESLSGYPLPPATAGLPYAAKFRIDYPNRVLSGGMFMPPGGWFDRSSGILHVLTNAPGTYWFTLVYSSVIYEHNLECPNGGESWFQLVVQPGTPGTVCEPTADPVSATVGVPFMQQWHAYDRPYDNYTPATFSVDTAPDGLTFSSDGVLSGTPTAPGPYLLHVLARSSTTACQMETSVTLNVNAPAAFSRLFWQHESNGTLAVWNMNGTTLTNSYYLAPPVVDDLAWKIVGVFDIRLDDWRSTSGHLLWQHQTSGLLAWWQMNGTSLRASTYVSPASAGDLDWEVVGAGNFDGFNGPDLLWRHRTLGLLAVWYMSDIFHAPSMRMLGSAYLNPYQVADLTWRIAGIADFNADGRSDILWRNVESGLLAVWLMNGVDLSSSVYLTPATVGDLDWNVAAVVDINGDGKPDIIWRHATSGFLAAWIMDGTTMTNFVYLTPYQEGDLGWKIRGAR